MDLADQKETIATTGEAEQAFNLAILELQKLEEGLVRTIRFNKEAVKRLQPDISDGFARDRAEAARDIGECNQRLEETRGKLQRVRKLLVAYKDGKQPLCEECHQPIGLTRVLGLMKTCIECASLHTQRPKAVGFHSHRR